MADSTPTEERDGQKDKTRGRVVAAARGIAYVPFGVVVALLRDQDGNPNSSTRKKGLARALARILAGVAGATGIYFTWKGRRNARRAREETRRNTREQLEDAQRELLCAQRELRLARQGQVTERFTRAVDQLGARDARREKAMEVRLGGIHALERIARGSPECYGPVAQILTAYVREHAPSGASEAEGRPPSPDIQAILAVLGRLIPDSRGEKA